MYGISKSKNGQAKGTPPSLPKHVFRRPQLVESILMVIGLGGFNFLQCPGRISAPSIEPPFPNIPHLFRRQKKKKKGEKKVPPEKASNFK